MRLYELRSGIAEVSWVNLDSVAQVLFNRGLASAAELTLTLFSGTAVQVTDQIDIKNISLILGITTL